jgi:dienelactone hydrolase
MSLGVSGGVFHASYEYGPQEERLVKQNALLSIFQTAIVRPLKVMIFPAASFLRSKFIDPERVARAKDQLQAVGGKSVKMETPDGDIIDGMYVRASDFKSQLEKYFTVIREQNPDGTTHQKLVLKEGMYSEEQCTDSEGSPYTYLKPSEAAETFIQHLKGLGMNIIPRAIVKEKTRGICLDLGIEPEERPSPAAAEPTSSHPTALIAPGSGMTYAAYKGLAVSYLMRGINVMMVDFRGFGESQGSPTAHKTKLDLETAYQYLAREKGVKNSDLLVHGHCLGGGPASDLAARRKGVSIILDRTFAEYREVAKNRFPLISRLIYKILPFIVNYNNAANLHKIEGNIAITMAQDDAVIPESQIIKQIDSLPESKKGRTYKLLDTKRGHTGLWTDDKTTSLQFNQFLRTSKLFRKLF